MSRRFKVHFEPFSNHITQEMHVLLLEDIFLGPFGIITVEQDISILVLKRTRVRLNIGASYPLHFSAQCL